MARNKLNGDTHNFVAASYKIGARQYANAAGSIEIVRSRNLRAINTGNPLNDANLGSSAQIRNLRIQKIPPCRVVCLYRFVYNAPRVLEIPLWRTLRRYGHYVNG